jgi:hypothetical protein
MMTRTADIVVAGWERVGTLVPKLYVSCWGRVNHKNVTGEGLPSHCHSFSVYFKNAHRD